ncbi:MAG: threonylcarbamoyl-AMP synthase, partial [Myxococcales bacterium]|nr:threonylcarbamoyl-AMP synthase [Myxococcales bacterium]
ACPTETQVGLLAAALDPAAVSRVLDLKGRTEAATVAVIVPDAEAVTSVATVLPDGARLLAARYWPGPMTLILPAKEGIPAALVRDGKVGVRVPGASPALTLARHFGGPLTATSANRTGSPPCLSDDDVRRAFPTGIDLVVPGVAPGGPPSTMVDATVDPILVLRQGAIRIDD